MTTDSALRLRMKGTAWTLIVLLLCGSVQFANSVIIFYVYGSDALSEATAAGTAAGTAASKAAETTGTGVGIGYGEKLAIQFQFQHWIHKFIDCELVVSKFIYSWSSDCDCLLWFSCDACYCSFYSCSCYIFVLDLNK